MTHRREAQRRRCPFCGEEISAIQAHGFKTCFSSRCRYALHRQERKSRRERQEAFDRRHAHRLECAAAVRTEQAAHERIDCADAYDIVILPVNLQPVVPLPAEQRREFDGRLMRLVDEVFTEGPERGATDPKTDADQARLGAILGAACTTCLGRCCLNGTTHAFIHHPTIRRCLSDNPSATPEMVLESYRRFLPEKTFRGGCVFQAAGGCSLPRALRSHTCNSARCAGLTELRDLILRCRKERFYLAAMRGERVIRGRFVEWVRQPAKPSHVTGSPIQIGSSPH